ncbi:MAG: hypothetical protein J5617_02385 [Bacilli bacterium]|nr:hypothetical protein [Bacilli bacterium]
MKKHLSFGIMTLFLMVTLGACGGKTESAISSSSKTPTSSSKAPSSSKPSSSSQAPSKGVSSLSISLGNDGDKAYITVRGTQFGYTADDFKWAWGLMNRDSSQFEDGKATPADSDFKKAEFDGSNQFTVKYCLTDIQSIKAGNIYRIYGGTPESYADIPFASNMFGANDATRKYYLRMDLDNSLTFENVQPLTYNSASVVEIAQADLPEGITNAGAYLKFGGPNSKGLTVDTINAWNEAGNIAGDFQRCIPSWQSHPHVNEERFWKIEDNNVFFYLYCGFIEPEEGWMVHFDLVSGNQGAGLTTSNKINGETTYEVGSEQYKVYSGQGSDEEHYWDCVGVYRVA